MIFFYFFAVVVFNPLCKQCLTFYSCQTKVQASTIHHNTVTVVWFAAGPFKYWWYFLSMLLFTTSLSCIGSLTTFWLLLLPMLLLILTVYLLPFLRFNSHCSSTLKLDLNWRIIVNFQHHHNVNSGYPRILCWW